MNICKICNSEKIISFSEKLNIFLCEECKNGYREINSENIIKSYSKKISMPNYFASTLNNRHHYNFLKRKIGFNKIKSILEIGAGDGALIKYIRKKQRDFDTYIIEPGFEFCEKLKKVKGLTVVNDYVENVKIEKKFDLVIMSHVLEHLEKPVKVLKYININLLNEGGYLYIDVPNNEYELNSKESVNVAPITHLYFFDAIGLKHILYKIGFNNSIEGEKYNNLPLRYIKNMNKLGRLVNNDTFVLNRLYIKAINKLTLTFMNVYRNIFFVNYKKIDFNKSDCLYNNIAIIVKK